MAELAEFFHIRTEYIPTIFPMFKKRTPKIQPRKRERSEETEEDVKESQGLEDSGNRDGEEGVKCVSDPVQRFKGKWALTCVW